MKALLVMVALALGAGVAYADVPYPPLCSVQPADEINGVLMAPGSSDTRDWQIDEDIEIRNEFGLPVPDIDVVVIFRNG